MMKQSARREILRGSLAVAGSVLLAALGAGSTAAAMQSAPQDEILVAGNFKVDIKDAESCADPVTAEVDPIEIEMHDVTQSNDPVWQQFKPGLIHYGLARFTFQANRFDCIKELSAWIADVLARGDAARRTISIELLDKKGRPARRYKLVDSFPVGLAPFGGLRLSNVPPDFATDAQSNLAELQVQVGRVDMDGGDDDAQGGGGDPRRKDEPVRNRGFEVEFSPSEPLKPWPELESPDPSWRAVSGGAAATEMVEATVGDDGERRFTPGKAYVSDITMIGYMTATRKALLWWMQNTFRAADDLRVDVTITPVRKNGTRGTKHRYYKTLIKRIKIPRLSAGSAEPIEEKIVLKAERYNDPP